MHPLALRYHGLIMVGMFGQVVAKCLHTCACTSHVGTPTGIQEMCYTRQGTTGAKWLRVRRTKPIKIYLRAGVVARNSRRIPKSLRSSIVFMPVESGDFCSREQAALAYFRSVAKIGSENSSLERSIASLPVTTKLRPRLSYWRMILLNLHKQARNGAIRYFTRCKVWNIEWSSFLLEAYIQRNKWMPLEHFDNKTTNESLMIARAMNFVCSVYYISCKHVRVTRPCD